MNSMTDHQKPSILLLFIFEPAILMLFSRLDANETENIAISVPHTLTDY